jgi:hypothetical protein
MLFSFQAPSEFSIVSEWKDEWVSEWMAGCYHHHLLEELKALEDVQVFHIWSDCTSAAHFLSVDLEF